MHQEKGVYGNDIVEVVYHESLKDAFAMKDGDEVEVTFFDAPKKRGMKLPITGLARKLYGREPQMMKT